MTTTLILTDGLVPTDPLLSSQVGGTMNLGNATTARDTTPASRGLLSNSSTTLLATGFSLAVGTDGVIADSIFSVGPVGVLDRTVVSGNVTSAGAISTVNGATINGTKSPNTTVQTRTVVLSVTFQASTNSQNVSTDIGNLAPGAYGTFTFNTGGAATFSAGTYFFDGLSFNTGSTMRVNTSGGSIFIWIRSSFGFQRGTQTSVGGNPNALRIVLFGAGTVFLEAAFTGTIVAPAATLAFQGSNLTFSGAFFGQSIQGGPNLAYVRNPFPSWTETPSAPGFAPNIRLVSADGLSAAAAQDERPSRGSEAAAPEPPKPPHHPPRSPKKKKKR